MSISSPRPPAPLTPSKFNGLFRIPSWPERCSPKYLPKTISFLIATQRRASSQNQRATPLTTSIRHNQLLDTQRRLFLKRFARMVSKTAWI